jgi:hypothetical protein
MMAKKGNDQNSNRPLSNLRVRWIEVELNGSDTTIEEALRSVERMRRPIIQYQPPSKPPGLGTAPEDAENNHGDFGAYTSTDDHIDSERDEPIGSTAVDPETPDAPDAPDAPRRKRGEGERSDRNAGIELIGTVNFMPPGKQSLKELFSTKVPSSDLDQALVICFFLQHTAKESKIGPGHILAGFKHVGKPVPKDLKQTIRNMKKNKAWVGFSDINDVRLTTEGENRVEHELGKASDNNSK